MESSLYPQAPVLIVDDDEELVELLVDVFEKDGRFDIRTANNGFEALVQLGSSRPDLMITDLRMPGMDGAEMIRALRAGGLRPRPRRRGPRRHAARCAARR